MSTAQAVLAVARSQLGYVEQPGNRTPYGAWYGLDGQPWCAMFVSWCAHRAGAGHLIPRHAYTPSGAAWFAARGRWGPRPEVGAVVFYDIAGLGRVSHVGLVETVNADGSWTAIEGNTDSAGGRTGGRVMRQRRTRLGRRGGFGYPAYGADTPAPAAAPVRHTPTPGPHQLVVDGDLGPATVTRLQQSLNRTGARPALALDGALGPASKRALQGRLNHTHGPVAVDGVLGRQTVRALQRNVGAGVDGIWGPGTTTALQRTLNSREL